LGAVLLYELLRARPGRGGHGLSMPYRWSLAGVLLFGVGGLADFAWHTLFGIEVDVEALLSPTHLTLAVAGVLAVSGPLRAARGDIGGGWLRRGPSVLSMCAVVALLMFMTQYVHPLADTIAARPEPPAGSVERDLREAYGVGAILVQSVLLIAPVLVL